MTDRQTIDPPEPDWPALVRDHGPAVFRTAFRLVGNRADADECFQETFAAALALARGPGELVRNWRSMLVRLAVARGVDRLRQRVRRTDREAGGADTALLADRRLDSRPDDAAERSETSDRLRLALSHLPSSQADAFCLICLEGWSYREAADHLGVSTDHVGVLVHRARAALRSRIDSILSTAPPPPREAAPETPSRRRPLTPIPHERGAP